MTNCKDYRKLQEFASGSYAIVLPKKQVVNLGAKPGDLMKLEQEGRKITIEKAEVY